MHIDAVAATATAILAIAVDDNDDDDMAFEILYRMNMTSTLWECGLLINWYAAYLLHYALSWSPHLNNVWYLIHTHIHIPAFSPQKYRYTENDCISGQLFSSLKVNLLFY